MVWIRQLRQKIKVLFEVRTRVAERSEDEDALLIRDCVRGGRDRVEVDFGDSLVGHFNGSVVVEDYGRL